jgi:hypothetical protein
LDQRRLRVVNQVVIGDRSRLLDRFRRSLILAGPEIKTAAPCTDPDLICRKT